jgi:hypothetical protein
VRHREHTALRVLSLVSRLIKGDFKITIGIDDKQTLFKVQDELLHICGDAYRITVVIMCAIAFIPRVDDDERRSPVRTVLIMLVEVRD